MERKLFPPPSSEKLLTTVAKDYPATTIQVSFPDQWEFVASLNRGDSPFYLAVWPTSEEPMKDRFGGLPSEVNNSLAEYRLYKLFQPWPQPIIPVLWDMSKGEGIVQDGGTLSLHLHPIGQAQVWQGERFAILWECYFFQDNHPDQHRWQAELTRFWQGVEASLGVKDKIFTLPSEPTFEEGYLEFLRGLGYGPDPEFEQWWSKELKLSCPHTIVGE